MYKLIYDRRTQRPTPTSIIHVGNYEFTQRLETHQFTILKNQFNI